MANKKPLTAEILAEKDEGLYNIIIKMGVTPGSKQLVNWFIYTKDLASSKALVEILNKVFPGISCFTNYSIEVVQQEDGGCTIIITTADFLFNIKNVLLFSRSLLEIASKNGGDYDFWEIEIDSTKL